MLPTKQTNSNTHKKRKKEELSFTLYSQLDKSKHFQPDNGFIL